jgi:hypothetical protein
MIHFAACLILYVAAQTPPQPAEAAQTYSVTLKKDGTTLYGFIKDQGNNTIRFEYDTPELKTNKIEYFSKADIDVEPEGPGMRDRRREKQKAEYAQGLRDAGYAEIEPGLWVTAEEKMWADRAAKIPGKQDDGEKIPPPPPPPPPQPGFLAQWGPHAALVAIALVLLAGIARFFLLSR